MGDNELTVSTESAISSQQPSQTDAMLAVIERLATNPDADVTKLEKMLDMQERVMNRNAEMAFNASMAMMQAELPVVEENGAIVVNGVTRSKFAKFEDINEAAKPVMMKYGFAVTFKVDTSDKQVKVTGILTHKDGHRETTDIILPVDASGSKNAVQAVGSSVKYGKRYVISSLLNISTSDDIDDDAQSLTVTINDEELANIEALVDETGANIAGLCSYLKVNSLRELPAGKYKLAISALESKRKQQNA